MLFRRKIEQSPRQAACNKAAAPTARQKRLRLYATVALSVLMAETVYIDRILPSDDVADRRVADASAPLTPGESALLKGIFGQNFRTDNITKYYHRTAPAHVHSKPKNPTLAYVIGGNRTDVHFVDPEIERRDFSRVDMFDFAGNTFVHEMTHIWQHRNGGARGCDIYDYTLTATSRFADFCIEQQAQMVADYTSVYFQPILGSMPVKDPEQRQRREWLARVVEAQFPAARQTRLQMQGRIPQFKACATRTLIAAAKVPGMTSDRAQRALDRDCMPVLTGNLLGQAPLAKNQQDVALAAPKTRWQNFRLRYLP